MLNKPRLSLAGFLLYSFSHYRQDVIKENINIAFPKLPEQKQKKLMVAFYSHLVTSLKEIIFYPLYKKIMRVSIVGEERLDSALELGRGVICLCAHTGNWEFSCPIALKHRQDIYFVRKPVSSPKINNWLWRRFTAQGIKIIPSKRDSKSIIKALKKGGVVFITFDQHAGKKNGIKVDLFSRPCWTYKSIATLVKKYQVPVVPFIPRRAGRFSHQVIFKPPMDFTSELESNDPIYMVTQTLNHEVESMICEYPEQWFCWLHRRWKDK